MLGYGHTGCILAADGTSLFVHGDGAIGADGPVDDVQAVLGDRLAAYRFPPAPDAERLASHVRVTVDVFCGAADRRVTLPLLASVARAPLGSPSHFVVHLAGETGSGKTSLARFAASFFGAELARSDAPMFSFAGTPNALEVGLSNAADVIAVVDDYLGTRTQQATADRLTRSATGGVRDRLRSDLTARPSYSPRGLVVSTGEDEFDRASAQARTLTVPFAPSMRATPEAFDRGRTAALSGTFVSTMGAYVQYLAGERDRNGVDTDGIPTTWATHLATVRTTLAATIFRSGAKVHPRGIEIVAELVAAFAHFAAWAEDVGAFTAAETNKLTGEVWSTLLGLLDDTAVDEAAQIVTMLGDALPSRRCHVTDRAGQPPPVNAELLGWSPASAFTDPHPSGPRIGFVHDGVLDLIPDAFVAVLRDAQRRAGHEPNLTRKRVATLLHNRGWLALDDARGTYGTRRRIGDRHLQVWPIALDVVFGVQTLTDDTDPDVVRASLLVRDQLDAITIEPVG